jgi:hypothetical protein
MTEKVWLALSRGSVPIYFGEAVQLDSIKLSLKAPET